MEKERDFIHIERLDDGYVLTSRIGIISRDAGIPNLWELFSTIAQDISMVNFKPPTFEKIAVRVTDWQGRYLETEINPDNDNCNTNPLVKEDV